MTTAVQSTEFQVLSISKLMPSPLNIRRHSSPKALDELTESIRRVGVLTPLLVRPTSQGFEIAAGHRRLEAAKRAGLKDVPVVVRRMSDVEFLEAITIENLQREDVHPLDEAAGYRALMVRAKYDVPAIAAKVGKSTSYVYQRLKLAELLPAIQKAFLEDKITAGHAILIARLQPKDQGEAFKQTLEGEAWRGQILSVRDLGQWIQHRLHLDLNAAPWKKDDATLLPAAGPCTTCPKRTGTQPELFPDINQRDTCTDRVCFAAKMAAHIARKTEELAAKNGEVLKLSEQYTGAKGLIGDSAWKEVRPRSCRHARPGIVMDGRRRGHVLTVCADVTCTKHHERWERQNVEFSRRADVAAVRQRRAQWVKDETRQRIMKAIRERVRAPLPRADRELIAKTFYGDVWHEFRKEILALWGWQPKKERYGNDFDAPLTQHLPKLSEDELARFLFDIVLARVAGRGLFQEGPDKLLELAKRHRINVQKINAEVKAAAAERFRKRADKHASKSRVQTSATTR